MLAVLEASIEQRQRASEQLASSLGPDARVEDVMRDAFAMSLRSPAWQAALTEFRIHAWRDRDLNKRYQALHERTIDKVTATLGPLLRDRDASGHPETRDLAVALLAANTGLVIESFAGGEVDMGEFVRTIGSVLRSDRASTTEATT